jgi:hypothetical protein
MVGVVSCCATSTTGSCLQVERIQYPSFAKLKGIMKTMAGMLNSERYQIQLHLTFSNSETSNRFADKHLNQAFSSRV